MRRFTENELQEILHNHKLWINVEGGERVGGSTVLLTIFAVCDIISFYDM